MVNQYSVLFVDDEVNILSSLKRGLIDEDYTCFFASSGKEALEIMEKEKISVIVSDMRMPEMDGLALLKTVKSKYPKTVRIVLSGYTQLQQILLTINQADIFKFITKPWKLEEEFKVVIQHAIEYYKMQEENEEFKKALENKNKAYQNILKSIEDTIANAKRSSQLLGECGSQILLFNRNNPFSGWKDEFECIQNYQEKIYHVFTKAVQMEEKEVESKDLIQELLQLLQGEVKISKFEDNHGKSRKMKVFVRILEALLISTLLVFKNEFVSCGLFIQFSEMNKKNISISLVCPNAYSAHSAAMDQGMMLINLKTDLLNTVLRNVAAMLKMGYCVTKTNGNIVAVMTI